MAELTKDEMFDHFADVAEVIDWYDTWKQWYPIVKTIIADEMTQAQRKELDKLDKKNLVWTQHGTCDNERITAEFIEFEGSGCGCYVSYAYHVSDKPHKGDDDFYDGVMVEVDVECPVCNKDGEWEGDNEGECPGPDLSLIDLHEIETTGCEYGMIKFYLT